MKERFKFQDGREMNAFWIHKTLTEDERSTCYKLKKMGILGWSRKSFGAARINYSDVEHLIGEGILKQVSLYDVAKEITSNNQLISERNELEIEGGFLVADNEGKSLIRDFDSALQIVNEGKNSSNSEMRYIFSNRYFQRFLQSLLPG
ncbi:MAG: hypothetical protein ABIJ05_01065 [Patescibacteria group bacterium]